MTSGQFPRSEPNWSRAVRSATRIEHALDGLESGRIGIVETAPEQLQQDYPTVQTRLDPGEAESPGGCARLMGRS